MFKVINRFKIHLTYSILIVGFLFIYEPARKHIIWELKKVYWKHWILPKEKKQALNVPKNEINAFDTLTIIIKKAEFDIIKKKRKEALIAGILISEKEDYVPVKINHKNQKYSAKIRLKGDFTDHIKNIDQLSFKVKIKGEKSLFGMKKFALQHPRVRNYVYEWLFHKILKKEGLIGLRYDFINLKINQIDGDKVISSTTGIYAIEEGFEKLLIEDNNRKAGIILKFNEDILWKDREFAKKVDNRNYTSYINKKLSEVRYVEVYKKNSVLKDTVLSQQFEIGKKLLNDFNNRKVSVSDAFDVSKIAKFTAISNLIGAGHGFIWHNLRFYYNPLTLKLEPIGFDGNSGKEITEIFKYFNCENDLEYNRLLIKEFDKISNEEYVLETLDYFRNDLLNSAILLNNEFDKDILLKNAQVIRNSINPSTAFTAGYLYKLKDENHTIEINSLCQFPIEIVSINDLNKEGKKHEFETPILIQSYDDSTISFPKDNTFEYPKSLEKFRVNYRVIGNNKINEEKIIPYSIKDSL